MKSFLSQKKQADLSYFQKGTNPQLLLMSGTHGDEFGVIEPLKTVIKKYSDQLPDFIFVPEVSPSAVKLKTRRNKFGHDTNRKFFDSTDDPEALAVMEIVVKHKFKLGVSFHEDIEYNSFYLYDSQTIDNSILNQFKTRIKKYGLDLFTGIDDNKDAALGNQVTDGYIVVPAEADKIVVGDFWDWSLINGYLQRLLYPEIPSSLTNKDKIYLIDLIFRDLIFKLL